MTDPRPIEDLTPITFYGYSTCPFTGKVRTFLDYHRIPYVDVEVRW